MPKMYHPTLPATYDDGVQVTHNAFMAAWEPRGWRLMEDEDTVDPAVEDLIAAVATTQPDEEE